MNPYFPTDQPVQYALDDIKTFYTWPAMNKRLLIMGPCDDGPVGEITLIYSVNQLEEQFSSGVMVKAAAQALKQSEQAVWVYRTNYDDPADDFIKIQSIELDFVLLSGVSVPNDQETMDAFFSYALDAMDEGRIIHGIVSVSMTQSKIDLANWIIHDLQKSPDHKPKHLSLVLEQFIDRHAGGVYAGNLIVANPYASLIHLPVPQSGFVQLTHAALKAYKELGVVAFKWKSNLQTVIAHTPCAVIDPTSSFRNISNVRMVQVILNDLRDLIEHFVSTTNPTWAISKIQQELDDYLLQMRLQRILRNYRANVYWLVNLRAVMIELDITPIFAVESIKMQSKVTVKL